MERQKRKGELFAEENFLRNEFPIDRPDVKKLSGKFERATEVTPRISDQKRNAQNDLENKNKNFET